MTIRYRQNHNCMKLSRSNKPKSKTTLGELSIRKIAEGALPRRLQCKQSDLWLYARSFSKHLVEKELERLETESVNDDEEAMQNLLEIAALANERIEYVVYQKPALAQGIARKQVDWPISASLRKLRSGEHERLLEALEIGMAADGNTLFAARDTACRRWLEYIIGDVEMVRLHHKTFVRLGKEWKRDADSAFLYALHFTAIP
jgi:hypothetical protein